MTLRRINHILTVMLVGVGVYIMAAPLWPQASWWVKYEAPVISKSPQPEFKSVAKSQIPPTNMLVIPRLDLQKIIHEGQSEKTLNQGAWHRPGTGTPEDGNMVIAGHRFNFGGQSMFYHLDKMRVDDEIGVYWKGEAYTYRVTKIEEVTADDVSIEQPSEDRRLTIYTCTPLWSAKNRLVVHAKLIKGNDE